MERSCPPGLIMGWGAHSGFSEWSVHALVMGWGAELVMGWGAHSGFSEWSVHALPS